MRRVLAVAAVVLLVGSTSPTPVGAADAPSGSARGGIDTCGVEYVDHTKPEGEGRIPTNCDQDWDVPAPNAPTWAVSKSGSVAGSTPTGIAYSIDISETAGFELVADGAGNLTSAHIFGTLKSKIKSVGETEVNLSVSIPFKTTASTVHVTDNLSVEASTKGDAESSASAGVTVSCTGIPTGAHGLDQGLAQASDSGETSSRQGDPVVDVDIVAGDGNCRLDVNADASAEAFSSSLVEDGKSGDGTTVVDVTLTAGPTTCDLEGTVRDGASLFDPYNLMAGIPVDLVDGFDAVQHHTVTDAKGHYCFHGVAPADTIIRASLEDGRHDPPIFRTVEAGSSDDIVTRTTVKKTEFGLPGGFDIDFSDTPEQPLRSDAAAVHREASRFVEWVLGTGIISVAEIGTFTIETENPDKEGTRYNNSARIVRISGNGDSAFAARDNPWDECPENCEWHEIGHHILHRLQFPESDTKSCGPVNHGGWINPSTCDSVKEGVPTFLALLGSVALDADRGGGYGTTDYSQFGDFERGLNYPWDMERTRTDELAGREDMAVAQLMWDLVDDTPTESRSVPVKFPGSSDFSVIPLTDGISIDAKALIRALATSHAETVVDIRTTITASGLLPASVTKPSIDLNADGAADVSALDAVFLMHEFHPVPDIDLPVYVLGDAPGFTDRQPVDPATGRPPTNQPGTFERHHLPSLPGSAIRLENPSSAEVTATVEISYADGSTTWSVKVPANGSELVKVELPPYWSSPLSDNSLPACGTTSNRLVTLSITAPGMPARTLDSCAYFHAVAESTGDAALTYAAAVPGPSNAPTSGSSDGAASSGVGLPIIVGAAVVALVVLALVMLQIGKRRRPAP